MHANPRPRRTRLAATNLLVVLLFAAGCAPGSGGKVVDVEKVGEPESTRTVTADGTLEASRTADIQAEAGGRVVSVDVLDGQTVSAGQAIVRLDASGLEAQLEALESDGGGGGGGGSSGAPTDTADLEKAFEAINGIAAQRTANLVQQIALLDPSVLSLPNPTEQVASCTLGPAFDPTTCAAVLPLQQDILAIQQGAAEYQTQVSTDFQGSLLAAAANFALASALGSAGGGSGQLDAQEAGLRTQIDAMVLTSPIAGAVALDAPSGGGGAQIAALGGSAGSSATLQTGTLVSPGAKVATVYDTASLRVEADVDEADVPLVKAGQTASVTIDAYPGQELQGRVSTVALNPATGESGGVSYQVNVDVPADELPGWRPGMTATVDIEVEQPTPGIELPASAVVTREGKDYVFVLDGDTATRTEVAKVQGGDGFVVVTSGLEPGDVVVTSGAADLEDGDKVSTEAPE
ncbi:MAG: efflux RND transporter periplasmic adaptor subunit [Acidimicrobiia bacterium]|nr:efflux RND transporter periplasmic adaptor subunit [Acidimicrobiia bacterium]